LGAIGFLSGAVTYALVSRFQGPEAYFLSHQDLPVLVLCVAATAALGFMPAIAWPPLARSLAVTPLRWTLALAILCAAIGMLAAPLVFGDYVFSLDEFLAGFDARIFARGELMAPVDPAWRPYVTSLQPIYMLPVPGHAYWASGYLPINAAIRAAAGLVGADGLVNPLLSGFSVVATYGVGRRLWPEGAAPLIAAALLATSSQLLVTSMTAYAMPAHLAFNLAWLWLFLRGGRLGHAGAIAVGFLASGLHQVIFHPMFAAPFVLQLWLDRRWRLAGTYTLAYGLICAFWIEYWQLELGFLHVASHAAAGLGGGGFAQRVLALLAMVQFGNLGAMAESLVRFVTWQNPLTVPLALAAGLAALRAKGVLRALVAGVLLTLVAVLLTVPSQTHGWGYRYLHGLLGSVCLIAAWSWTRLTVHLAAPAMASAKAAMAAACAFSLVVLLPLRAAQAGAYCRPYAAVSASIQRSPAEVVVVSRTTPIRFDIGSIVRNEPFLRQSPKVMLLAVMDEPAVRALCATHRVAVFDEARGASFGVDVTHEPPDPNQLRLRRLMAQLGCGADTP
jgi:hypothetical protein